MPPPVRSRPRPLADLVGPALTPAFRRQGFAATEIVTHWDDIVGAEVAGIAEPMKIEWPRRREATDAQEPATLVLRVEGPAAIEVQHMAGVIVARINQYFGWPAVGRLAMRQAPLQRRRQKKARRGPDSEAVAAAAAALPPLADQGLRDALARLGAAVKRR
ncbi:DciA family protein [Rhodoplanes sp. TEM]|uniref:DciA family protein n=1 Tax=Rhodoplanes tepidamans TaxID=200616 RepID=A0ABT5JLB8_RHOTP|nr:MULTISPECIES: DciA family protein [Rhodoplanes]MDC7790038.1 DciA family protein [Rhodoplanes tepidamans]MDC7986132.1 DciA family protein [Rhodoplanes sp. TEM]MDQ0358919.1 hypothetical protein [Rhodoplanes tepidamans]